MFKYFWEKYYLWDSNHLHAILEVIFIKTTWGEVLKYIFNSSTTEDIFYTMSYQERESFVIELFRRYLGNAPIPMVKGLFERLLEKPFAIIGLKGLIESSTLNLNQNETTDMANAQMIKCSIENLKASDYADMTFNADIDF